MRLESRIPRFCELDVGHMAVHRDEDPKLLLPTILHALLLYFWP